MEPYCTLGSFLFLSIFFSILSSDSEIVCENCTYYEAMNMIICFVIYFVGSLVMFALQMSEFSAQALLMAYGKILQ